VKLTKNDCGCIIDESAGSADDLSRRIIAYAADEGFDDHDLPDEESEEYSQTMYEISEEAVEFLNDHTEGPVIWMVEDNSLFLVEKEGA
jgi:hypothetical protein